MKGTHWRITNIMRFHDDSPAKQLRLRGNPSPSRPTGGARFDGIMRIVAKGLLMAAVRKAWHVGNWTALGWLETLVKAAAILTGVVALVNALGGAGYRLPEGARLIQLALLTLLALGLAVAIYDRYLEREIIAMIFVLFNNLGHWGMALALLSPDGPGGLLPIFCLLMLLGDLVKLRFLMVTGFTVRGLPRSVLYGLTGFYAAGYTLILFLELLR